MKKCSKCIQLKDESFFNKSSKSKDGLHWWCKQCVKEYKASRPDIYRGVYQKYKETSRLSNEKWKSKNPGYRTSEKVKKRRQERERERYKTNIQFKMARILRERLRKVTKNRGHFSAISLLGCSLEEFKTHIESQFQEGMNWNNWGRKGWHLDHIMPLSRFDLSIPSEVSKACHYTNLQPLWWQDNLSKWANIK